MNNELILLKIRYLITKKDVSLMEANREMSLGGWRCNWSAQFHEHDLEIEAAFKELAVTL